MEQVVHGQAGQQTVHPAIGRHEVVVKPRVQPGLEILPAPFRVDMGRPSHGQRVHAKARLEDVRGIETVLAARTGQQAVVTRLAAELVAQDSQLVFPVLPVDRAVLLLGKTAGIADPFFVKRNRGLLAGLGVLVLHGRVGSLVGDHTLFAKVHITRQTVHDPRVVIAGVKCRKINGNGVGNE